MPSLASSNSTPSNEMSAISSDTVNPMPATVAAPTSGGHGTVRGNAPNQGRDTNQVMPTMPRGLPSTRPRTMPRKIGAVSTSRRTSASSVTPALARAKSGTTT
jgi:hypothetical protein